MRKRTIQFGLDRLMWYIIYLFPVLLVLLSAVVTPLGDIITTIDNSPFVSAFTSTDVYTALNELFGTDGLLPMFTGSTATLILSYMTYFVHVLIIHLAVDFLVFIPRLAHKWFNKVLGGATDGE